MGAVVPAKYDPAQLYQGYNVGASFMSANVGAAAAAIFTAAANVNGAILRHATIRFEGTSYAALYIGPTAPAAYNDVTRRFVLTSTTPAAPVLPFPLYVPVGWGAWFIANSAGAYCSAGYDLL